MNESRVLYKTGYNLKPRKKQISCQDFYTFDEPMGRDNCGDRLHGTSLEKRIELVLRFISILYIGESSVQPFRARQRSKSCCWFVRPHTASIKWLTSERDMVGPSTAPLFSIIISTFQKKERKHTPPNVFALVSGRFACSCHCTACVAAWCGICSGEGLIVPRAPALRHFLK